MDLSSPPLHLKFLRQISKWTAHKRGLRRFNESLQNHFAKDPQKYVINDFDGGLKIVVDLSDHILSHIFWNGFYSTDELQAAKRFISDSSIVLDIGANIGEFTLFAAHRAKHGSVFSFEPSSHLFQELKTNVQINKLKNVSCVQVGLSDRKAKLPLYSLAETDKESSTKNRGKGTVFPSAADSSAETIELETLDNWARQVGLSKLDIVKIDIEGSELFALRGGAETFCRLRPVIFIEINDVTCRRAGYSPSEIPKLLRSWGYEICGIGKNGKSWPIADETEEFPRDVVCIPRR